MKPRIMIVGSSNTDMVIKTDHLPAAGETILGGTFFMNPGGKGANQAVAAARLGGNVTFICKTGNDIFGHQSVEQFMREGIDTSYLLTDPANPSGVALITVDKNAENCIVVASGSNATLSVEDLRQANEAIENAQVVLLQLEIPLHTVEYIAYTSSGKGAKIILNPAPACKLPHALLQNLYLITPNAKEAEMLSGITVSNLDSAKSAAAAIQTKGVKNVIITLGKAGAMILEGDVFTHIPAFDVQAVDTTAAGDIFNGALAVALSENKTIAEAVRFSCKAASVSVTRMGAQSSAPYRKEVG